MLREDNNIDQIVLLLKEKNNHLEMFYDISERERKSFKARNFDNLEDLYRIREDILENIHTIDSKIEVYSASANKSQLTDTSKKEIESCLGQKEKLVNKILEQDLQILSCIESEKSSMLKKLTSVRTGRRLLKAYRTMPDILD
ncbi:MAG: flagellar protein FliT [Bdellovibrionales bacterium]|nr:flagellar protein FliT [Bdellovibrionales bacterium]